MNLLDKVRKLGDGVKASFAPPIIVNSTTYRPQSLIAEGGFGFVYLALDPNGRSVALKKLILSTVDRLNNAKNEIKILKVVSGKPHIISLLDAEIRENLKPAEAYVLMPYYSGGSLVTLLNNHLQQRLPEQRIVAISWEVALAVHALHSQKPPIIHRDLKLENILLDDKQNCFLCDFGSATRTCYFANSAPTRTEIETDLERNTTLIYRAPEMVDLYMERWIDEKVDIWALGCLIYKLLYLVSPFETGGKLKIINAKVDWPKTPTYSDPLIRLLKLIFTADPNERPDIEDVLMTLALILNKEHLRTIPKSLPKPAPAAPKESKPPSKSFFDILEEAPSPAVVPRQSLPKSNPPPRPVAAVPPVDDGPVPVALAPPEQAQHRQRSKSHNKAPESTEAGKTQPKAEKVDTVANSTTLVKEFFGNVAVTAVPANPGSFFNDADDFSNLNLSDVKPKPTTETTANNNLNVADFFKPVPPANTAKPSGGFFQDDDNFSAAKF